MMSDIPESSASVSDSPQLSRPLEESDSLEIPTTISTPTGTTVIAKYLSPDKTYVHEDPSQTLTLKPSQESSTVEVPNEEVFVFDKLIKENTNLSWAAAYVEERSSSSDSLMRELLQPPPSMRFSEPYHKTSSMLLSQGTYQEEASSFQEPKFHRKSSSPAEEATSPQRHSKRRRSELGSTSQTSSASEKVLTPPWPIDTYLGDLDAKSALFLARNLSPPILQKPFVQRKFSTAIDPYAVGLATMHEVLRDGDKLTKELERDARRIGRPWRKDPCPCNVSRHPSWWTVGRIQDIHNYSFLLDCQGLVISKDIIVAANITKTIIVYDVPMKHNHPVKHKAEQVLRFIDVEIGFGDQTSQNLFHYVQPINRKVLLVVSHGIVVGIVVAEGIQFAHRILRETVSYMELEEDPVPVRVGINRLWVHVSMRRKHLASMLCQLIGQKVKLLHHRISSESII